MIELQAPIDIWNVARTAPPSQVVICIPCNGTIKKNGAAVMGRGVALQAKQRFPHCDELLGRAIRLNGLRVQMFLSNRSIVMYAFPTKRNWWNRGDLSLIEQSAMELNTIAIGDPNHAYYLPRPGVGEGRIPWPAVRRVIRPFLPDNVIIVHNDPVPRVATPRLSDDEFTAAIRAVQRNEDIPRR